MTTVTVQIGNSDDKLSQATWAAYVQCVRESVAGYARMIHFFGASAGWERWQNAAWVIECAPELLDSLRADLIMVRAQFEQDSIAFTAGKTEFM